MSLFKRLLRSGTPAPVPERSDPARELVAQQDFDASLHGGRFPAALRIANTQIATQPAAADWQVRRATVLAQWGRIIEAKEACARARALGADDLGLAFVEASVALASGDASAAEGRMRMILQRDPASADALQGLAISLYAQRRLDDAARAFVSALDRSPGEYRVLHMYANLEIERGNPEEAERLLRRAIELHPDEVGAWKDLSVVLAGLERHDESLLAAREAQVRDVAQGGTGAAFVGLAINLRDGGHTAEAVALLAASLPGRPVPDGHYAYSIALLTAGSLQEGFDQYEFRWLKEPLRSTRCGNRRPAWTGQDLHGKTLLLRVEQGLGDTFQMLRYVPWVKALGATLMMRRFDPIVDHIPEIDIAVGEGETPDFDYYVNLMSLPRIFGTALADVPARVPYVAVPAARREAWARRLGAAVGLRVGLVWAGSPGHLRDSTRSLSLQQLQPLFDLPGIRWFSLQKGPAEAALRGFPDAAITPLGEELGDFIDTAAVIESLDLVVTVDTAVAHLAGALGRPVWVMVSTPADWRWLEGRDDTPWYPTMRLFRQHQRGDWADVVHRVRSSLADWRPAPPQEIRAESQAVPPGPSSRAWHSQLGNAGICDLAETRYGVMQLRAGDPGEGQVLQWTGEWMEGHAELLRQLIDPDATIVFAGVGAGSRILALWPGLGPQAHVVAVEGDAADRQILRQNLVANGAGAVTVLEGRLDGSSPDDSLDGLQLEKMSWLVAGEGISGTALIDGASDTLWKLRPGLSFVVPDEASLPALTERVRGYGYRVWSRREPWFRADNFNARARDMFGGRSSHAVVAVPEEVRWELPDAMGVER